MSSQLQQRKSRLLAWKGAVAATVTPFNQDESINESVVPSYLDYLVKIGVKGAYVHATTGEGVSLAHEEKKSLTKAWVDARAASGHKSFLLVINVTSCVVHESQDHAKYCNELGVDGVAFLPPFYYRPSSVTNLTKYISLIASAAPDVPLILYHYPEATGVDFSVPEFLTEVLEKVPSFTGFKYTSKDIAQLTNIQRDFGSKIKFFAGYEEMMLAAFAVGLDSGFFVQFNFKECVRNYHEILDNLEKDLGKAQKAQAELAAITAKIDDGCYTANVKRMLQPHVNVGAPRVPIFE